MLALASIRYLRRQHARFTTSLALQYHSPAKEAINYSTLHEIIALYQYGLPQHASSTSCLIRGTISIIMSAKSTLRADASEFVPSMPFHIVKVLSNTYTQFQLVKVARPIVSRLRAEAPVFVPVRTSTSSASTVSTSSLKSRLRGDAPAFVPAEILQAQSNAISTKMSKTSRLRAEAPEFVPGRALLPTTSIQFLKPAGIKLRPQAQEFVPSWINSHAASSAAITAASSAVSNSFKLQHTVTDFIPSQTTTVQQCSSAGFPANRITSLSDVESADISFATNTQSLSEVSSKSHGAALRPACTHVDYHISKQIVPTSSPITSKSASSITQMSTNLSHMNGNEKSEKSLSSYLNLVVATQISMEELALLLRGTDSLAPLHQPHPDLDTRSTEILHETLEVPVQEAAMIQTLSGDNSGDTQGISDGCSTHTSETISDTTLLSDTSTIEEGHIAPGSNCEDLDLEERSSEAEPEDFSSRNLPDHDTVSKAIVDGKLILAAEDRPIYRQKAQSRDIPLPFFKGFGPSLVEMRLELLREITADPNACVPPSEPEVFHHRSFLGYAVQHITATSPSLSFAVLHARQTPWLSQTARLVDLRKHAITMEAYKLIDPVIVSGQSPNTQVRPLSSIRHEVTGIVSKFYTLDGTWRGDVLRDDDDYPELDTEYEPDYPQHACIVNGYAEGRGQASVFSVLDASRWHCDQLIMERSQRVKGLISVRNECYLDTGVLVDWYPSSPLQQVSCLGCEEAIREEEDVGSTEPDEALVEPALTVQANGLRVDGTTLHPTLFLQDTRDMNGKLATGSNQPFNFAEAQHTLTTDSPQLLSDQPIAKTLIQIQIENDRSPSCSAINSVKSQALRMKVGTQLVTSRSSNKQSLTSYDTMIHHLPLTHHHSGSWMIRLGLSRCSQATGLLSYPPRHSSSSSSIASRSSSSSSNTNTLVLVLTESQVKLLVLLVVAATAFRQQAILHAIQAPMNRRFGIGIQSAAKLHRGNAWTIIPYPIYSSQGDCVGQIMADCPSLSAQQSLVVYQPAGQIPQEAVTPRNIQTTGCSIQPAFQTYVSAFDARSAPWQYFNTLFLLDVESTNYEDLNYAVEPHSGSPTTHAAIDELVGESLTRDQHTKPQQIETTNRITQGTKGALELAADTKVDSQLSEAGLELADGKSATRRSGQSVFTTFVLFIFVLISGLQLFMPELRNSAGSGVLVHHGYLWFCHPPVKDIMRRADCSHLSCKEAQVTIPPTKTSPMPLPPLPVSEPSWRREARTAATPTALPSAVLEQQHRPSKAVSFWRSLRRMSSFAGST